MLHLAARLKDSGFTLLETMTLVVVVGVLGAIATPSFLAGADRRKLDDSTAQLQGAIQEAQQQSIRRSTACSLTIDTNALTIAETISGSSCLPTGNRYLNYSGLSSNAGPSNGFAITTDASSSTPTIAFTFRGTTSTANVFVLYKPNSSIPMRCLAVSQGIGILRIGTYNSSTNPPTSVSASNCQTTAQ